MQNKSTDKSKSYTLSLTWLCYMEWPGRSKDKEVIDVGFVGRASEGYPWGDFVASYTRWSLTPSWFVSLSLFEISTMLPPRSPCNEFSSHFYWSQEHLMQIKMIFFSTQSSFPHHYFLKRQEHLMQIKIVVFFSMHTFSLIAWCKQNAGVQDHPFAFV